MRAYIAQNAQRYADICEKRAAAGRLHTGNQYTRMELNGTNGTSVPTLEQNGTNGSKAKAKAKAKANNITKEKEKRETTPK